VHGRGKLQPQAAAGEGGTIAPIFLDLKFHDIPNTVAGAVRGVADIDCFMITVHTSGGFAMMKAAADQASENAAKTGKKRPLVVGVTILTSMEQTDLDKVGYALNLQDQVLKMASLAQSAGLDGVVCSPREISAIKRICGKDFKLVVPGIRPVGSNAGDQKRVMTPKEAVDAGADYLVIGRPITGAPDPKAAAREIMATLQ
jgi:orotidine-5'-phosphate decarboxylase